MRVPSIERLLYVPGRECLSQKWYIADTCHKNDLLSFFSRRHDDVPTSIGAQLIEVIGAMQVTGIGKVKNDETKLPARFKVNAIVWCGFVSSLKRERFDRVLLKSSVFIVWIHREELYSHNAAVKFLNQTSIKHEGHGLINDLFLREAFEYLVPRFKLSNYVWVVFNKVHRRMLALVCQYE